jgi:hypothetical protein
MYAPRVSNRFGFNLGDLDLAGCNITAIPLISGYEYLINDMFISVKHSTFGRQ